jgi:hypothetical protein
MTARDTVAVKETKAAAPPVSALMRDFLTWVAGGPRSHADAMEAWRSSCPRFTIWEDALDDGLIRLECSGATMNETVVLLTPHGQARLAGD